MGDYTRAASLPNAKRDISVQHAARSQFKRVSIYLKRFSSTILQKFVVSHDKGSYTDFRTVYTFSKDAQIVGDFLEELDAVTTFYVAIFIQEKEIQMKLSEEFSNTVVRLGGLHSALNFLSLLGKKFRFYVSAFGNIFVFGLMIFITLSFFNIFQ